MQEETEIKLTSFSRGAGCGCKISPAVLEEILKTDSKDHYPQLLVGNNSRDDAAVYDTGNGQAIISTTDFFMPIVDDAFDFGRIASANSISDIYAMGGRPLMAIAVLGWPVEKIPSSLARRVLEGAREICREAGIPLAGGHSLDSAEPIFGLAVTGTVATSNLKRNDTSCAGDILFMTKALGTGILSTAQKRDLLKPEHLRVLTQSMTSLNKAGEMLGGFTEVHAMTDVTGFGLAGHLVEMMEGAGYSANINYSSIPLLEGTLEYLSQRIVPDATFRNWNSYGQKVTFDKGVNVMEAFSVLPDPQTNGGLLFSVDPSFAEKISGILKQNNIDAIAIGKVIEREDKIIRVSA
jgi:selenide,water dikinase